MRLQALLAAALAAAAAALSLRREAALSTGARARPPSPRASAGGASLCSEGRLLPQLYVPGTMKSGTTTMFNYLNGTEGANIVNPCPWGLLSKECAFFNAGLNWLFDAAEKRERWLQELTPCPAAGTPKQVAGDFTPSYLNSVPTPAGMELRGFLYGSRSVCLGPDGPASFCSEFAPHAVPPPPGADPYAALRDMNAPRDIANVYGDLRRNLTFVVILREPVSRMQSQWYFARQEFDFTLVCSACEADTFEHAMQNAAGHHLGTSGETFTADFLWDSLYAKQLQAWLSHFDESQFVVVPNSRLDGEAQMTELCEVLQARLDYDMDCEHFLQHADANPSDHPPLDEDISPETLALYQEQIFAAENSQLFSMLASMHAEGASLIGFDGGAAADAASVEEWLTAGW